MLRLYVNTVPFHKRDLGICGIQYAQVLLKPISCECQGIVYSLTSNYKWMPLWSLFILQKWVLLVPQALCPIFVLATPTTHPGNHSYTLMAWLYVSLLHTFIPMSLVQVRLLWTWYKCSPTARALLHLASSPQHWVCETHPFPMWLRFACHCCIVFRCVAVS